MQRSSGVLLLVAGYLFIDVLVPSSRVKKSKKNFMTSQNGIDNLSRNVDDKIPPYLTHFLHRRRELLGYYASCGNSLQTFWNNIGPIFKRQKSKKGLIVSKRRWQNTTIQLTSYVVEENYWAITHLVVIPYRRFETTSVPFSSVKNLRRWDW